MNDRNKDLRDKLYERQDQLTNYATKADKYRVDMADFTEWFSKAYSTPGIVEPIGTEPDVVKRQLKEVEVGHCLSFIVLLPFPHNLTIVPSCILPKNLISLDHSPFFLITYH